jgi:DNA recombination protein RmuC
MDTEILGVLLVVLVAMNAFGFWWLSSRDKRDNGTDSVLILQKEVQELARTLDTRLRESSAEVHDSVRHQFSESQRIIQDTNSQMLKHLTQVTESVTEVREGNKQVFTIAEKLQNLERVLTHQKQRGELGEAGLKLVLENMLPATAYELQYRFENGEVVDAIVKTKEGIIPVDAKFSLDNYNRLAQADDAGEKERLHKEFKDDLKKRIDETAKYIRPKEGTLPFAFMYIPAEGIYYDLLVNPVNATSVNSRSLIDYAYRDKNVVIVSPTTFAAYLQSVLYGFRAFQIEESAKEIGKRVEELARHLKQYDESFKKVGTSLNTTVNHYSSAQKELGKIDKDVFRITGTKGDLEKLEMEKVANP